MLSGYKGKIHNPDRVRFCVYYDRYLQQREHIRVRREGILLPIANGPVNRLRPVNPFRQPAAATFPEFREGSQSGIGSLPEFGEGLGEG